jgi:HD-GYP domain-containing protein (c-di-GMP phosphodiesterase class II)
LRGNKPTPPGKLPRAHTFSELEVLDFKLAEHGYPVGTFSAPATTRAALLLVLSGQISSGRTPDDVRTYLPGSSLLVRESQPLQVDAAAKVWQVTGSCALLETLERFSTRLVRKDAATAAHSARVALCTASIGSQLGLRAPRLDHLSLAAFLHDLGKLSVPRSILQTRERLTLSEWQLMTQHPGYGRRLLEPTPLAFLGTIVEQHHERLNGSGYPLGLVGNAVQLESYIVAVADTFDAITYARPYQGARSPQQALSEINRYSDILYPREVVSALNAVIKALIN